MREGFDCGGNGGGAFEITGKLKKDDEDEFILKNVDI